MSNQKPSLFSNSSNSSNSNANNAASNPQTQTTNQFAVNNLQSNANVASNTNTTSLSAGYNMFGSYPQPPSQQAPQSLFSNAQVAQHQAQQQAPFGIFSQVPSNAQQQQQQAMHQGSLFNNPYINTNSNINYPNSNMFNYSQMPIPSAPPQVYGGYGGLFGNVAPQQAPQDPAQLYNDDEPLI